MLEVPSTLKGSVSGGKACTLVFVCLSHMFEILRD